MNERLFLYCRLIFLLGHSVRPSRTDPRVFGGMKRTALQSLDESKA